MQNFRYQSNFTQTFDILVDMMNEKTKFKEIYEQHWLEIKRFIYVETGRDASLTEDIFQNTWMNVYTYISTLRDEASVRAWLYAIAKNETKRYFHKNKTRILSDININEDDLQEELLDAEASDYPDTLANEDYLARLLGRLTDEEQQLILLHYYYDLPINEIAEMYEVNYNTLKSSVRRALLKLRQYAVDTQSVSETVSAGN